jgi:prephenate dehydratase
MNAPLIRYGYLGPTGTFTEVTGRRVYSDRSRYEGVPFQTNRRVLEAVASGEVEAAIVPIENSMEGAVNEVVDGLIQLENLWITGETTQLIEHHLIGLEGAELSRITTVRSHPQALAQCRLWLNANLPDASVEQVASTAAAVGRLGEEGRGPEVAAIGSRHTLELNGGVKILAEGIHDSRANTTRFITVAREECEPGGKPCKTSIVISTAANLAGSLVDALNVLKAFRINMTKIESRPAKTSIGDYLFLIDFMGHHREASVVQALRLLRDEWVTSFRLLGSYPRLELDPDS